MTPPPLAGLADVVAAHAGVLVVDEAHALGVAGPGGRGLVASCGLGDRPDVVSTATLSKALGCQGGVVLGSEALVDHIVNTARPFIYDTGLAPAMTAAATAALTVVEAEPHRCSRVLDLAALLATALGVDSPAGAVLSVPVSGPEAALRAQARLAAEGVGVGCFRPPSVPDGVSRLRLAARATLTDDQVDKVLAAFTHLTSMR